MNNKKDTGSPTRGRLQTLLDEYRRRVAAGEALRPRQFLDEHADLGDEDREQLATALQSHGKGCESEHRAEPPCSDQEMASGTATAGEESPSGRTTLPPKPFSDDSADQRPSRDHPLAAHTPDAAPAAEPPETTYYQSSTAGETLHPRPRDAHNALSSGSGEVPEQFGRYRITQCLGHGAMGSVYLAEDAELDRRVALKIPKFRAADSLEFLERFRREAKAAATLRHANICPVYDVGEIDGVHYLSMAYIEGQPLSKLIGRDASQPESEVVHIVHRLASALSEAHSEGVIHRDLKPANIMIDENGEPIIMDFGLARRVNRDDIKLTHSGGIMGSPAYMSPEQVEGDTDKMGPGCDIYSLGVIFYELLTGRVPFQGSVGAVMGQILSKEPQPPSELRPGLDPRLEAICLKMLAKNVEDRVESMRDVIAALSELPESPSSFQRIRREPAVRREESTLEESAKSLLAGRFPAWMIWTGIFVVIAAFGLTWTLLALTLRMSNERYNVEVDADVRQAIEGGEAALFLDGVKFEPDQLRDPLPVASGEHRVEIRRGAETPIASNFTVSEGQLGFVWYDGDTLQVDPAFQGSPGFDRRAAVYLLQLGGRLQVSSDGITNVVVEDAGELPADDFRVTRVNLSNLNNVTNNDARHISVLTHLRSLDLSRTEVTGEVFTYFQNLSALRELAMNSTEVDDSHLPLLEPLLQLEELRLVNTNVTESGVEELEDALKFCSIFRGID